MNAEAKEVDVEAKARDMGWATKDAWRGPPEQWIDAETFVKRGEEILPIVKASERRGREKIDKLEHELTDLKAQLLASRESIDALKAFNTETARKVAREEQKKIATALAEARRDGNIEAEVQLTEQFEENRAAIKEAEAKPVSQPAAVPNPDPTQDPGFQAWKGENPWFLKDQKRTRYAIGIAGAMKLDPEFSDLKGKPFFDEVTRQLDEMFGTNRSRESPAKVEGGRASGGGGGDGRKTYSDVPAEDRAVCERQAAKLVGKGRAYEKIEDWRKDFTRRYFEE